MCRALRSNIALGMGKWQIIDIIIIIEAWDAPLEILSVLFSVGGRMKNVLATVDKTSEKF